MSSFEKAMSRFTNDQIREYQDAFCLFDRENIGYILEHELRDLLKTIGMNPTDKALEKVAIIIDKDGNGKFDFEELIQLIDKLETEEKNNKEARDAFNAFDFLGRGYVAAHDIREAIMFIMEKSTKEDQEAIIAHFKLKVNRKIYFREFKEMVTLKRL